MSLFTELKRRNVFRAGVAYMVAAWLLIQVVETIFPAFGFGDSAVRIVVIVVAIGLAPALIFAWVFEFTPEGLKREHEVDHSQSIAPRTGQILDRVIIVVLTLALVYFAVDEFVIESKLTAGIDKSIAVLPFSNRSAIADDVYFVDGIHDDILTQLANLSGLDKVISRTSTERYRQTTKTMSQIGDELGVATILEGGVQRAGNRVHINMQLIDANTDNHLWAETYDRELTAENLFAIQSEISHEIVRALHAILSDEDSERLNSIPTANLDAYEAFVLGRQGLAKRTAEGIHAAKAHFEKAIELDSNYALAYVGLADSYILLADYAGTNLQETFAPRQAAIDRALELDPRSGEAYASFGNLRMFEDRPEEAEKYFLKAIDLSPNYATSHHWYALLLSDSGRVEEAVLQMRQALKLDPAAPILTSVLALMLNDQGRVEEAQAATLDGIRRNPEFPSLRTGMASLLRQQGRTADALRWALSAREVAPMNPGPRWLECRLYVELGDDGSAETCLNELRRDFPQIPESDLMSMVVDLHVFRSQYQDSIDYLAQLLEQDQQGIYLRYDVAFWYAVIGQLEKAGIIYQDLEPAYFTDDEVDVNQANVSLAVIIGAILHTDGQFDRANYLFEGALRAMQSMHRTRGNAYGIWDVPIYVTRGELQNAISALREAIDGGWRSRWWYLRAPVYDAMRAEPEWNALIGKIEANIAHQRMWFEEHKDEPLY